MPPNKLRIKKLILALSGLGLLGIILGNFALKILKNNGNQNVPNQEPELQVIESKNALVSGFPQFPIYPGSSITSSQHNLKPGLKFTYQAYLENNEKVSTVISWYMDNLAKEGWKIERAPDPNTPEDQNIVLSKEKQTATVNVEREGISTRVSIFVSD